MPRRSLCWAVIALIVATAAAGAAVGAGTVARASALTCPSVHFNTLAQNNNSGNRAHRGTRVYYAGGGMFVENVNAVCDRVSSLMVASPDFYYQMEVGWFDAVGQPNCSYGTSGPYDLWAKTINGVQTCDEKTEPQPTEGSYADYSVFDSNGDGSWQWWANDSYELAHGSIPAFTIGLSITNSERHSYSDYANAEFKGLQYEDANGWENWVSPSTNQYSNDPDYCNSFPSDTHVSVATC